MRLKLTNSKKDNFKIYEIAKIQVAYAEQLTKIFSAQEGLERAAKQFDAVVKALGLSYSNIDNLENSSNYWDQSNARKYRNAEKELSTDKEYAEPTIALARKEIEKLEELLFIKLKELGYDDVDTYKKHFNEGSMFQFDLRDANKLWDQFPSVYLYSLSESELTYSEASKAEAQFFIDEHKTQFEKTFQASLTKQQEANASTMSM